MAGVPPSPHVVVVNEGLHHAAKVVSQETLALYETVVSNQLGCMRRLLVNGKLRAHSSGEKDSVGLLMWRRTATTHWGHQEPLHPMSLCRSRTNPIPHQVLHLFVHRRPPISFHFTDPIFILAHPTPAY